MRVSSQYDLRAYDRHDKVHKHENDIYVHWTHRLVLLMLVEIYSKEITIGIKNNEEQKNAHQAYHKFFSGP